MSLDFGTLRSLFNQPATAATWALICEELGRVEPAQYEAFDDSVRPYCEAQLRQWPRDLERRLPEALISSLQSERPHPALTLVNHLKLSHLKGDAFDRVLSSLKRLGPLVLLCKLEMTYCEFTKERFAVWVKALEGSGLESLTLQYIEVEHGEMTELEALLTSPLALQLRALDLSCSCLADAQLASLVKAEALSGLEVLDLSLAYQMPLTAAALGEPRALPGLRILSLNANGLDDEQLEPLMCAPRPALVELNLRNNRLTDRTLERLIDGQGLSGLRVLDLWCNHIGDPGLAALCGSERMAELEQLHLGLNVMLSPPALVVCLAQARAPRLVALSLNDLKLEGAHVETLAQSEVLRHLERLNLNRNALGNEGAQALASSPHLTKLRELSLSRCHIGSKGIEALMRAPWVAQLERLDLSSNPIGNQGAQAIAAGPCSRLKELELGWCTRLTERGERALANSASLPEALRDKFKRD